MPFASSRCGRRLWHRPRYSPGRNSDCSRRIPRRGHRRRRQGLSAPCRLPRRRRCLRRASGCRSAHPVCRPEQTRERRGTIVLHDRRCSRRPVISSAAASEPSSGRRAMNARQRPRICCLTCLKPPSRRAGFIIMDKSKLSMAPGRGPEDARKTPGRQPRPSYPGSRSDHRGAGLAMPNRADFAALARIEGRQHPGTAAGEGEGE